MSDLFRRVREGAGKAAFEAYRLKRLTAIQATVRSLRSKADKAYFRIGQQAYLAFEGGEMELPAVKAACEERLARLNEIAAREQEIEAIRQEVYVPEAPPGMINSGLVCPNGHGRLLASAAHCQECGAPGVAEAGPTALACGHCGAALEPAASFCAECGTPVAADQAGPEHCRNCGAELFAYAEFCAECGMAVTASDFDAGEVPEPPTRTDEKSTEQVFKVQDEEE